MTDTTDTQTAPSSLCNDLDNTIRVLLVDDQAMVAKAVEQMLADEQDIDFYYCQDPTQAIERAIEIEPTVILQDLVMPEVDGLTLVRFFRRNPATQNIPIIVLSSKEDPEIKGQGFEAGANDYLVKLPHAIEVLARIRYHSKAYSDHKNLQKTVKKLEETQGQLLQSEKMASIGQLAAGVAHEINNPVGFVNSNIGSLQRYLDNIFKLVEVYETTESSLGDDSDALDKIKSLKDELDWEFLKEDITTLTEECVEGLSRVKNIVQDLKSFSHVDKATWQQTDLNKGMDSTLTIAEHEIKYKADVVKDYGDLPEVDCIPSQINQVFMNLVVNAAQAMEERGTITLRSGTRDALASLPENAELEQYLKTFSDELVWFDVEDTGKGIEEDKITKIFDPFFTTKPVGKGTGLGLSLSYGIISQHNGLLTVRSEVGVGTGFTIILPVKQDKAEAASD